MNSPLFDKIRGITADVLNISANQLTSQSSPDSIDTWDSIHHLNLILAFEQEFAVQFEPDEIDRMNNFGQILDVLQNKLGPHS